MPAGNMGSCSCGIPLSYPKALPLATSFFLDHSVFINDLKLPVEIRRSEIQALDRTQPGLPRKKGRCGTMTHDYKRNGTTTLFAALELAQGKVVGECYQR